jgi:hypothetical protein
MVLKISPSLEFERWTVQPIASCYTNCEEFERWTVQPIASCYTNCEEFEHWTVQPIASCYTNYTITDAFEHDRQ